MGSDSVAKLWARVGRVNPEDTSTNNLVFGTCGIAVMGQILPKYMIVRLVHVGPLRNGGPTYDASSGIPVYLIPIPSCTGMGSKLQKLQPVMADSFKH